MQREKKGGDWVVVPRCTRLCDVAWVLTAPLVQHSSTWHFNEAYCCCTSIHTCVSVCCECARGRSDSERDGMSMPTLNCGRARAHEHLKCHQNLILFLNSKQNQVELTYTAGVSAGGRKCCVCVCLCVWLHVCERACACVSSCVCVWQQTPCGET